MKPSSYASLQKFSFSSQNRGCCCIFQKSRLSYQEPCVLLQKLLSFLFTCFSPDLWESTVEESCIIIIKTLTFIRKTLVVMQVRPCIGPYVKKHFIKLNRVLKKNFHNQENLSLYIYHFSTVVDFSSEKYRGSTGRRNSWYQ